jgi:pimeloyl-ACP methyl ester carboxylesterase
MRRGFLEAAGRIVHYRRAGRGPALLLLHGSPNSSESMTPLIETFAADFDCIALDTPGNGESEPLVAESPSTEDYAAALGAAVEAAGLKRFCLYGFHTGAGIAAEYAARHPERVTGLILDGVAAWTSEERAGMLQGYLPPFHPSWDGAHLAWLWARIMEQAIFFPWHRPSAETRMNYDLHPPDVLHRTAMEFLAAGDAYRKPYAAALAGDGAARIRRLTVPTLATAHPLDPIAHHLERLAPAPPCIEVRRETREDVASIRADFRAFFKRHAGDPAPDMPTARRRGAVAAGQGVLAFRAQAGGRGRPVVFLHEAGGSSRSFADNLPALGGPAVALDLPGHGESDPIGHFDPGSAADAVGAALAALALNDCAVIGRGLGGAVALELKRRGRVARAALIGATAFTDLERAELQGRRVPDLTPRWDGAHLIAAWRFARLERLFDPWSERKRANIVWGAPDVSPERVHLRAHDVLKSAPWHGAAFDAELGARTGLLMRAVEAPTVFLEPGAPWSSELRLRLLAAEYGAAPAYQTLADAPERAAETFREFAQ